MVPKFKETGILIILIAFTLLTLVVYSQGLFNTTLDVLDPENGYMIMPVQNGGPEHTQVKYTKNGIELVCNIIHPKSEQFCGITVLLSDDIRHGRDFSHYQYLNLQAKYDTPQVEKGLRIYLRNFNPDYSSVENPTTIKFNSFSLPPPDGRLLTVPMDLLQVATWWIDMFNIDLEHSRVETDNVSMVEVISNSVSVPGIYDLKINRLQFQGELISAFDLAKMLLAIWFLAAALMLNINRLKLKQATISDPLTETLNRRGLINYFNQIQSTGNYQRPVFFYINLDNFKQINDSLGHVIGDHILNVIAGRIQNFLTENSMTDRNQPALGRFSSDEYLIIFCYLTDQEISHVSEQLHRLIDEPVEHGQFNLQVHASIGVATAPEIAGSFEDLFTRADAAMRIAKQHGKNQTQMFDSEIHANRQKRRQLAADLRQAISRQAFELVYMPIYESHSQKITAVEALIRCNYAPLKGISPEEFIPIAEEYDLIHEIDLWVIETIFRQLKSNQQNNLLADLCISINISGKELYNINFVNKIASWLLEYGIDPALIELEITETFLVEVGDSVISNINHLKELGFSIALDDFGTGYMAFNQLTHFPVDTIKIDKSFVMPFDPLRQSKSVTIEAVLSLAESFNLKTIAEGVETEEQYLYLKNQKCQFFQGYFKSPPIDWQTLCNNWARLNGLDEVSVN